MYATKMTFLKYQSALYFGSQVAVIILFMEMAQLKLNFPTISGQYEICNSIETMIIVSKHKSLQVQSTLRIISSKGLSRGQLKLATSVRSWFLQVISD